MAILLGILVVAAVSTIGDYVWYEVGVPHRMTFGIVHGAVLLAAVGGVIGAGAGRVMAGLPLGAAAGVGGALVYYALEAPLGRGAMLAGWAAVWILISILNVRLLQRPRRSLADGLVRGVIAALAGGLAFYLVGDDLWGRRPPGARNYLTQYGLWIVAWAPGILAVGIKPLQGRRVRV
jgi:hypothetical protein